MNSDIVVKEKHLPADIDKLKNFIIVGREKLKSLQAELRAITKLELSKDIRDQKLDEAQWLAEFLLDAEVRMGELLKPLSETSHGGSFGGSKKVIPEGISHKQSHFFQKMARNKDIVEEVKAKSKEREKLATREAVLRMIKKIERANKTIDDYNAQEGIIIHGDAFKILDTFEDDEFDILFTDPPFSTEFEDFQNFLDQWLPKAVKKIKKIGKVFIFTGSYIGELSAYIDELSKYCGDDDRFNWGGLLIWTYRNAIGPKPKPGMFKRSWQGIFYIFGKESLPLDTSTLKDVFDTFDYAEPDGRTMVKYHSWQKPEEVIKRILRVASKEGDKILDPFAGSGTIGLAAAEMGRPSISIEINSEYIEICKKRGLILKK